MMSQVPALTGGDFILGITLAQKKRDNNFTNRRKMATMSNNIIALSCPSCGAKLDITPDIDRFACSYCGQEHIVNRTGGIVALSPVIGAIKQVGAGVDKVAAELALVRLSKEITDLQSKKDNYINSIKQPEFGNWAILCLGIGGVFALTGACVFFGDISDHGNISIPGMMIIFFGLLVIAPGLLRIFIFFPRAKKKHKEYITKAKYWDDQIEIRQTQIKQFNELLSQ